MWLNLQKYIIFKDRQFKNVSYIFFRKICFMLINPFQH